MPQRVGEAHTDVGLDLRLVDALDLILDRVFDGQDLAMRLIQDGERSCQRGGLAAAGWAGDQHEAMRCGKMLAQERLFLGGEAELGEVEHALHVLQQADGDGFPVDRGHGRDRASRACAASILTRARPSCGRRRSAMSSPERILTRDTMARAMWAGAERAFRQHPVDAEANVEPAAERLDVDVGRASIEAHRAAAG